MATKQFKKMDERRTDAAEIHQHNIGVIMPFIKFGVGAINLIAHTLIYIVKHIPKPGRDKQPEANSGGRIIKVK